MNDSPETYGEGQCTDYLKDKYPRIPNWLGNAIDWLANAGHDGLRTGGTPEVGAVVVYGAAYSTYGHVAMVTALHPDGTFTVDEANYTNPTGPDGVAHPDTRISGMHGVEGFIYDMMAPEPPAPAPHPAPPTPAPPSGHPSPIVWAYWHDTVKRIAPVYGWDYATGPLGEFRTVAAGVRLLLDGYSTVNGITYAHINPHSAHPPCTDSGGGREGWIAVYNLTAGIPK